MSQSPHGKKGLNQCVTRGQKVQSRREREIWNYFLQFREEKEKSEIPFPSFEERKRNLIKGSPLSRRERERDILFSSFERRKRKWKKFSTFEKRQRNLKCCSPTLRREREIWKNILHFREEKEKGIFFSQASRGERESEKNSPLSRRDREIWNAVLQRWEEKEKFEKIFSTFEKRKRKGYSFLKLQEEKEKFSLISYFSRKEFRFQLEGFLFSGYFAK